jgi:LuxR family glucitol operon transcriptional activator
MKILILEANPHKDLSLDKEIRQLRRVIDDASDRNKFQIKDGAAVKANKIQELMLELETQDPKDDRIIVHFCGHGTGKQGLVFENENGERDLVSTDTLTNFFELFKERIACVVMNACYSEVQAEAIVQHIDYVIGMNQAIRDDAAIAFSIGFYRALGYGRSIEDSFKFGKNAIQLQITNKSITSNQIAEEIRKFVPIDGVSENKNIVIPEQLIPVLKKKIDLMNPKKTSYCNLPHRNYSKFIGRTSELQQLLKQISPNYRQHIAIVEGIGGVGKTALVLETAYLCWEFKQNQIIQTDIRIPIFDAIIFTSAKKTWLTAKGILKRPRSQETLQEIFRTIANVLNEPSIIMAQEAQEQLRSVYESLSRQRTILIIDNMETISDEEKEDVISFLAELPQSTKAIITSRNRIGVYKSIRIFKLSEQESFQLIAQEAENKGITVTDYEAKRFYGFFGGIPVALIYAVGQRAMGYSLKKILGLLDRTKLPQDLAHFLFKRSVEPLQGQSAHKLLLSITFFQTAPSLDALVTVAGLQGEPIDVEEGLATLQQLSLVSEEEKRYSILPITHKYALDELAKYPEFLESARQRWVEWYIRFTKKHGGKDWQDWRIEYDYLAQEWENIASVLYWCAAQDRYEEIKQLWQNIDRYVDLGCYWRTRRHWWGWLIKQSDRRADLPTYVRALSEKAWTLTLMGDDEAKGELAKAWKMREYAELDIQAHLANHIAVHRITQKKYNKAVKWLQRQEQLVNQAQLEEKEQIRHQVCIAYYRAEIAYWKCKDNNEQADYDRVKELFQKVFDGGKAISWQRFTNYAQNWLSELFIIEGNLQQAEKLLNEGLLVAERNRERRRIGHYQASYARLEAKRNNYEKAREWGEKALYIFDREGIKEDAEEIRSLLDSLPSE